MKRFREDRYISDEGVEGTQAMRTQDDAGAQTQDDAGAQTHHTSTASLQSRSPPLSPCT